MASALFWSRYLPTCLMASPPVLTGTMPPKMSTARLLGQLSTTVRAERYLQSRGSSVRDTHHPAFTFSPPLKPDIKLAAQCSMSESFAAWSIVFGYLLGTSSTRGTVRVNQFFHNPYLLERRRRKQKACRNRSISVPTMRLLTKEVSPRMHNSRFWEEESACGREQPDAADSSGPEADLRNPHDATEIFPQKIRLTEVRALNRTTKSAS